LIVYEITRPGTRTQEHAEPDVKLTLLFREGNNRCVAAMQQRRQYIRYDTQLEFLVDGSIEN
jgi:hypothetical protein